MNFAPLILSATLAFALGGAARAASATLPNDPRIPINAVNTPGDATAIFVITQAGSYYLEDHVVGEAGKDGIRVASSDVKLDLMGFRVIGFGSGRHGIAGSEEARTQIEISDGLISNWGGVGINFPGTSRVELSDLSLRYNGSSSILIGANSTVERCNLSDGTSNDGIVAGFGATIAQSQVTGGYNKGISVGNSSIVQDCVVHNCFAGIVANPGSSIRNCNVTATATGITATESLVVDSNLRANFVGVRLTKGTLRGCEISNSQSHGVELFSGGSLVVGNRIASNGGDGVLALAGARIEENDVRSHPQGTGIRTLGTGSVVVRNTLVSNSIPISVPNFGNFVGPLVSLNAAFGRDDPWTNLHGN